MPAPYSQDLRARVAATMAAGASARSAAGRFGVSASTAVRWAHRLRVEGHASARAMGGDRRSRLLTHRAAVITLVAAKPDRTLSEIRAALAELHAITVGLTTLWRFLAGQKITRKKRACMPPSKTAQT